ncbi:MAG: sigma-70 family RNA polymerase sigma factor [Planctomycetota bacterium]|nr:MAG: sigma-70 family RNA polymerase sigma factor [Planctomycetota bacterium]
MATHSPLPADTLEKILIWTRAHLGEASGALLQDPTVQERIAQRLMQGAETEDAVLAGIHGAMHKSPYAMDEFIAYFHHSILLLSRRNMSPALRRALDTADLAQSVWKDLVADLGDIRFYNRAAFISLMAKRLRWKAADRLRNSKTLSRRLDLQVSLQSDLDGVDGEKARKTVHPLSNLVREEERRELAERILQLPKADREMIRYRLQGMSKEEIQERTGWTAAQIKASMQRARRRLRNPE